MWYSCRGHQQGFAFCSACWVRSRDLLDMSTTVAFHFRQFLLSTTLTTRHAVTIGNHDTPPTAEHARECRGAWKGERAGVHGMPTI